MNAFEPHVWQLPCHGCIEKRGLLGQGVSRMGKKEEARPHSPTPAKSKLPITPTPPIHTRTTPSTLDSLQWDALRSAGPREQLRVCVCGLASSCLWWVAVV
jgi:hypothetical protein